MQLCFNKCLGVVQSQVDSALINLSIDPNSLS